MSRDTGPSAIFEDAVSVPASVVDMHSFREWAHSEEFPKCGRIAFIGGEINIEMSPEEIETHNKVRRDWAFGLGWYLDEI